MATAPEIQTIVIDQMLALYRPPKAMADQQQVEALRIYTHHLTSFSLAALQDGWKNLVRTHKASVWPTVAEIIAAVHDAGGKSFTASDGEKGPAAMLAYAKTRAPELVSAWKNSHFDLVQTALRNGWIYDMKWILEDEAELYAQYEWRLTNNQIVRRKDGSAVYGMRPFDPPGAYAARFGAPRPATQGGDLGAAA